jgi:hypothetical protein
MARILKNPSNTDWFVTCDSVEDAFEAGNSDARRSYRDSSHTGSEGFSGTRDWEHAEQLALHGWDEGITEVDKYRSSIVDALSKVREIDLTDQYIDYDVAGAFVDVGLYMEGEPECMGEICETNTSRARVIDLHINLSAACHVDEGVIRNRGAALAALVDVIEEMGIRVGVYAVQAVDQNGSEMYIKVCVKKPEQPMQVDRVAFAIGHPSALRRMMFGLMEYDANLGSGYGRPAEVASILRDPRGVYIPGIKQDSGSFSSVKASTEWVIGVLKDNLHRLEGEGVQDE